MRTEEHLRALQRGGMVMEEIRNWAMTLRPDETSRFLAIAKHAHNRHEKWTQRNGKRIRLSAMSDEHIVNAFQMLSAQIFERKARIIGWTEWWLNRFRCEMEWRGIWKEEYGQGI